MTDEPEGLEAAVGRVRSVVEGLGGGHALAPYSGYYATFADLRQILAAVSKRTGAENAQVDAADQIERLKAALRVAQVQLAKAADQFAFYADEHAKKGTADGDAKGATNHQWALACARVDHEARAALGDRGGER